MVTIQNSCSASYDEGTKKKKRSRYLKTLTRRIPSCFLLSPQCHGLPPSDLSSPLLRNAHRSWRRSYPKSLLQSRRPWKKKKVREELVPIFFPHPIIQKKNMRMKKNKSPKLTTTSSSFCARPRPQTRDRPA